MRVYFVGAGPEEFLLTAMAERMARDSEMNRKTHRNLPAPHNKKPVSPASGALPDLGAGARLKRLA
jgi:hypothetical protein